jgi:predicted RNA-binding protein with PUA-like domain
MNYWLMKTEPSAFSLDDLKRCPKCTEHWDGVRNYQARNFLRDGMQKGDLAFFYHSSCAEPGIAGIVEIARSAYPDHTAWNPDSGHFDPKSSPANPIWYMVDVRFVRRFEPLISLQRLRRQPALRGMQLLRRGNRLSIMPVAKREWAAILKLEPR